jgi:RHS repeat-associated protein
LQKDLCVVCNNKSRAEYMWTLPEVGESGSTGGDDGAGGYMPLAILTRAAATINWVHSHHNAKPILLTNSTGAVVAYGGHAVLGFPGQFANAVGLAGAQYYYNRYRDYNDATGRYIQADPIGLAGDPNPYAYAMGNTLSYMDPEGLQGGVVRFARPPTFTYRPANAYDAQIQALNARGRELNPRYQGFQQMGSGATARDVITATNMFARTQAEWAFKNGLCLGTGQPGANGIVYLRIDNSARLAPYYGQSISPNRFEARQREHERAFPRSNFDFINVGGGSPGRALTTAEHNAIQGLTGGIAARNSPFVSNQRDAVGPARRPAFGLPEPK